MKLLLDQNLSVRLVELLSDVFPGSSHTALVALERASDLEVWEYARKGGFCLVSKDSDLSEIGLARGFPPPVIWIRRGNCSTGEVEQILRRNAEQIARLRLVDDGDSWCSTERLLAASTPGTSFSQNAKRAPKSRSAFAWIGLKKKSTSPVRSPALQARPCRRQYRRALIRESG